MFPTKLPRISHRLSRDLNTKTFGTFTHQSKISNRPESATFKPKKSEYTHKYKHKYKFITLAQTQTPTYHITEDLCHTLELEFWLSVSLTYVEEPSNCKEPRKSVSL